MLESLKEAVYSANMLLVKYNLVVFTWGNVSGIDRERGLVVIKPSGVSYADLSPNDLPVLDLNGNIIEGKYNPSTDTPTHLELYRSFPNIGGVTHTHSPWATSFAQAGRGVPPYGTTHADYFDGQIPCTRKLTPDEIAENYETNTGRVIVDTLVSASLPPERMRAVLVHSHAPFTWGTDAAASVETAVVLEQTAMMALHTELLSSSRGGESECISRELLRKHFDRKHGPEAYYGQK